MLVLQPINNFPLVKAGDSLPELLFSALKNNMLEMAVGDILVLTQKIVSKAEGRLVNLQDVRASDRANELSKITKKDPRFIELVLRESRSVLRVKEGTIIVEHRRGFICANAGIDHSNVLGPEGNEEDWYLLLPEDPERSASEIREALEMKFHSKLGVMIIDSHGRAWRNGTVGVCIGLSGMPGLIDLRGRTDLFGYRLQVTQVGAADELAAAASLVMGQANESTPVVHVRGFPYALREASVLELIRPEQEDLFR